MIYSLGKNVEDIKALKKQGLNQHKIASHFNKEGRTNRDGKDWTQSLISRELTLYNIYMAFAEEAGEREKKKTRKKKC